MDSVIANRHCRFPLRPLAACLAVALSAAPLRADAVNDGRHTTASVASQGESMMHGARGAGKAFAARAGSVPRAPTTVVVTNCDDSGPGSLRDTVAAAVSGDTVDMSALTCSTITLTSGAIVIPVDDLTLLGPGQDALAIDADLNSHVLSTNGSIEISDLTLTHGYRGPRGACLYAAGNAELTRVTVQACFADNMYSDDPSPYAGGGVFVGGNLTMTSSTLQNNGVKHCSACGFDAATRTVAGDIQQGHGPITRPIAAAGGGAYVGGDATITASTITFNSSAGGFYGYSAVGGGLAVHGHLTVLDSTLASNWTIYIVGYGAGRGPSTGGANRFPGLVEIGGGLYLYPGATLSMNGSTVASNSAGLGAGGGIFGAMATATIMNSTLSGNSGEGAGLVIGSMQMMNSTVADNDAYHDSTGGVIVLGDSEIESSIIARNQGDGAADLSSDGAPVTISGANNLIMDVDPSVAVPPDTLHADPLLAALADNGGPTWTMALLPHSPAIDVGNDVALLATDQRGPGYPRVVGANADIGAYEVMVDVIFADGFD